jgi:phage gpG-like protein
VDPGWSDDEIRRRVAEVLGVYLAAAARDSFDRQADPETGERWPERYQYHPALNVAGAIEDLRTGARIKSRRYDRRPAGRDTGTLIGRITHEVRGDEVLVGSDVPYADQFHEGGVSVQVIDEQVRQNLARVLKTKRRAEKRAAKQAGRAVEPTIEEQRLGPLFGELYHETQLHERPFTGAPPETQRDIETEIQRIFDGAGGGSADRA